MANIFENFKNLGKIKSKEDDFELPLEPKEDTGPLEQVEEHKRNLWPFYLICFLIFFALTFRLLQLQISQGLAHRYLAEGNRIRSRDIPAPRGEIIDAKGNIVASNIPSYSLEIYPADLPSDKNQRQEMLQKISQITAIDLEELKKIAQTEDKLQPYVIKDDIDRDKALLWEVQLKNLPAMIVKRPQRVYHNLPTLSHLLGYVGKVTKEQLAQDKNYNLQSVIGQTGLEKIYEKYLKGQDGKEQLEVNAKGQIQRTLATQPPTSGASLTLSLDLDLQRTMSDELSKALLEFKKKKGAAIALNPKTGEILGMVSLPSFDNNLFVSSKQDEIAKIMTNPDKPLLNRSISGQYPSGSTIKPLIASAGLQEKVITAKTTISDPGEIRIGNWVFPDWKAHGSVDVYKAIAESCNVFFYSVGGGWQNIKGLGIDRIRGYLSNFGLGAKTQIDLPGEAEGLVPSPEWKKKTKGESWYVGDTYHVSIGQGDILVTPLQLLNAVSTIANGGQLLKPHLVSKITNVDGKVIKEFQKEVLREGFISNDNLQIVKDAMRQTVTSGTAGQLASLPVEAAAKTGTAQFGQSGQTHAWFVAFAPYEEPKIAVIVLVEGGGEGHQVAQPTAKNILQYYFSR